MKRTIILIIITIALIFIGFVLGAAIENKFDILSTNKEVNEVVQEYYEVENQYFNMVNDKHERELVVKSYEFLSKENKSLIDYSIGPEISIIDVTKYGNLFFDDDYYCIIFRNKGFLINGILQKDYFNHMTIIGIDVKTEKIIKLLPSE